MTSLYCTFITQVLTITGIDLWPAVRSLEPLVALMIATVACTVHQVQTSTLINAVYLQQVKFMGEWKRLHRNPRSLSVFKLQGEAGRRHTFLWMNVLSRRAFKCHLNL